MKASITGIHAAIVAGGDVVTVAWDMPFVPPDLVGELKRRMSGGVSAVIPIVKGKPEPLCAAYARSAAEPIAAAVQAGILKNSEVLAQLPGVLWLEEADVRRFGDPAVMFFNVNTAADLSRAEEIARSM